MIAQRVNCSDLSIGVIWCWGFLIHFYLETSAIREEFLRAQGFMFAVAGMILDNPLVKVANNVQIAC